MNQQEMNMVNKIIELKNSSSTNRRDMEQRFKKYYQMFNGILSDSDTYPWRSKLYMKETYKVIDTVLPMYLEMLFMKGDPFATKGVDTILDKSQSKVINKLIKVYIQKMELYPEMDDFTTELLVTGTAFGKMYWTKETRDIEVDREVDVPNKFDVLGMSFSLGSTKETQRATIERVTKDSPTFDFISYKDIFYSPYATSLKKSWVIHRTWKSLDRLKEEDKKAIEITGEKKYKNLKELDMYKPTGDSKSGDQQQQITRAEKDKLGLNTGGKSSDLPYINIKLDLNENNELEILEFWTTSGSKVYTVAGGQVLIREMVNPFEHGEKPFLYSNYKKRPGEIQGIGICELTEDGQDFLNTSTNQAVDSNTMVNNLMLIAARDAGVNLDETKARPGGVVFVDVEPNEKVTDKVQQLKFSKVDTTMEIEMARREIHEVSGANKIMQGTYESGAVRNTSQTRLLMAAGNKKFLGKIVTFENMFLKNFVRMLYSLIRQYMTADQVVEILGDKGQQYVKVTPKDIALDLDFVAVGARQLDEMEQLSHQLNNFLAVVSKIPMATAIVKFKELIRKIAENLLGEDMASDVVLTEKESEKMMKQMLQAQQQMGGQGSAGGNTQPNTGGATEPSQPNMGGGIQ